MLAQTTLKNITHQLWPDDTATDSRRVFAIVDCARDERIEPMLRASQCTHECLYYEPLTDALRAAAPHIIELSPNAEFTQQLLHFGWGQSWGIFLVTYPPVALAVVRHNYRKINRVQDPSGQAVFFRYYDPRVLRTYLPTCTLSEVQFVFGPVKEMVMEGEKASQLHCFKHNEQGDKAEFYNV